MPLRAMRMNAVAQYGHMMRVHVGRNAVPQVEDMAMALAKTGEGVHDLRAFDPDLFLGAVFAEPGNGQVH